MPSRRLSKTQKEKKYKIRWANDRKARAIRRTKRLSRDAKNNVINLSDYNLSESEASLLSKGLKFITTPRTRYIRRNLLIYSFNELARQVTCRILFHTDKKDRKLHPLYPPIITRRATWLTSRFIEGVVNHKRSVSIFFQIEIKCFTC